MVMANTLGGNPYPSLSQAQFFIQACSLLLSACLFSWVRTGSVAAVTVSGC